LSRKKKHDSIPDLNLSRFNKIRLRSVYQVLRALGPGVITGAADDDPSGIATYSQAGAKFGLGMLWMSLYLLPMIIIIQEMCARIGLLSRNGLAALIKKKYSAKIIYPISSLLLIANTINIGADLGAMSASIRIIFPDVPLIATSVGISAFIIFAEIFIPYHKYEIFQCRTWAVCYSCSVFPIKCDIIGCGLSLISSRILFSMS